MVYQLTPMTLNPGATFVTSGGDNSLWSIVANALHWYDGCGWKIFATFNEGIAGFAAQDLKSLWAIRASDSAIYHFNGIGWSPRTLPQGGARRLSIGFDGKVWCLDNDAVKPQVWWFDIETESWFQFGQLIETDPTFTEIASGGTGDGGIFMLAVDDEGDEWHSTNTEGTWERIPNVTQGNGKAIAAGPDHSAFVVHKLDGKLWKWMPGYPKWELVNAQTGFVQIAVQADGRLLAIDGSGWIYGGLQSYPSLKGFRGSDWNNAGTKLFAVRYDGVSDKIYRSNDGISFETDACGELPAVSFSTDYYHFAVSLMIPSAKFGDTVEKMLISPVGSQILYLCDDISQTTLTFIPVFTDTDEPGSAGVVNGFAEDADRNVYAGWYSILSVKNKAILYKSSWAEGYSTWRAVKSWEARHIHTVRVNPFNGHLYVILGEPRNVAGQATESRDTAKIMRSKDGGVSWVCVTDTWALPVVPGAVVPGVPPFYLGLYFVTLDFIKDRVVVTEDTDFNRSRIFYFDDDGRNGSDPGSPLPFTPQPSYTTCNNGELFLGAVRLGERLYFASQFLAPTLGVTSTRCVSTSDGVNWRLEQVCAYPGGSDGHASFGIFTYHPERGGRLIYALSANDSFVIDRT